MSKADLVLRHRHRALGAGRARQWQGRDGKYQWTEKEAVEK